LESGEANMASLIKVKRSNSTGVKPTGLSAGELAINTFDKVLYSSDGTTVFELSKGGGLANTNSFIKSQLANTNAFIATKVNTTTFNSALANTNTFIATKVNTTTFNSALANTNSFIKSQLANTNTYIATKADSTNPTTSGVLAHTGRATISTNLNVSGNTVISKLVANGSVGTAGFVLKSTGSGVYWDAQTATGVSTATFNAALANTNSFIATKVNTTTFNSALANTNSFIKSQLANTNSFIATKVNTTTFNSALANTNSYIATKVNTTTFNSALANTNTFIATKVNSTNPTTSGVLAHTGRATISTNLAVTANTSIGGNLSVTGNLVVSGTQTFLDSTTVSIGDNMIKVANNNVADIIDIGLYSRYVSSGVKYSGMIRDASDGVFKFFYGLTTEPDQTINFGNTTQAEIDAIIDGGTFS